jgi:predicted nucleic acid-binding protein
LTARDEAPARLVLDAGPLIAFFYAQDDEHSAAVRGFAQLADAGTRMITPLPVVFEVYKWLAYRVGPAPAHRSLAAMRRLEIAYPGEGEFAELTDLINARPRWSGSSEDVLVALTGLKLDIPVWTLNYRDLAAFRNLRFWTPV